jgi:alpha-amylase
VAQWWTDGADQIAFGREGCGFVAINRDENTTLETTLATSLPAGTYCDVLTGGLDPAGDSCLGKPVTVDADGMADVSVSTMQAMVLHEGARVAG